MCLIYMKKYKTPIIVIKPPGPKVQKIINTMHQSVETTDLMRSLGQMEAWIPQKEEGVWIVDPDGNVFLDFTSFHSVLNIGRRHPRVVEACKHQLDTVMAGKIEGNNVYLKLLKKLAEITPGKFDKQISLGLSGSDANEGSIKIARLSTNRPYIIGYFGAYHGQTHFSMELTALQPSYRKIYPPIPGFIHIPYPYCYHCPFNLEYPECELHCLTYIEDYLFQRYLPADEVAAVSIEPIQGDGGNIIPPSEYLPKLKKICESNGVLLIDEEVQTGFGRTGRMFACENWLVEPDIMVLGKAIGAGMPISACVYRYDLIKDKDVALDACFSTTAANPLCCAAALANIEVIQEEKLVKQAATIGEYMIRQFKDMKEEHRIIGDVRGLGMMIGIEMVKDKETKRPAPKETELICKNAYEKGLALIRYGYYGSVLRIHPPLIITKEQVEIGLEIIENAISQVEKEI